MSKDNLRKETKFFISLMKEKIWLEQMALEGWKLKELMLGMRYIFEPIEPKPLVYEIDRFNLPKNPTIKDIKHKEEFLSVANEMGWEVITHDEDLNYYLCKEFQQGEINELYNDVETRQLHADKYRVRYQAAGGEMMEVGFWISVFFLILAFIEYVIGDLQVGFLVFGLGYAAFCLGINIVFQKIGEKYYKELMMTEEQWKEENSYYNKYVKVVHKCILRGRRLHGFLEEQSKEGWHIVKISMFKYTFKKGEPLDYDYILDSKYDTNKRRKKLGEKVFKDEKDWGQINNDWQIQSVIEAEEKGWNYVCALENRVILYRGRKEEHLVPINNKNKFYIRFMMGQLGVCMLVGGIVGFIVGFAVAMFS